MILDAVIIKHNAHLVKRTELEGELKGFSLKVSTR